jgi:hypothetical protein
VTRNVFSAGKQSLCVSVNSAFGYSTPKDMLAGRQQKMNAERHWKLERGAKNSGRFVASRLREERKGLSSVNPLSRTCHGRVLRICKLRSLSKVNPT